MPIFGLCKTQLHIFQQNSMDLWHTSDLLVLALNDGDNQPSLANITLKR